jgi:nucleoid DNA-binding protein
LSKVEIIKLLKKKNQKLSNSDLKLVVEHFLSSILVAIRKNKNIEIRNFGAFFLKELKENFHARNPLTNKLIYKPNRLKLKFRPSKYLKKIINK